ncbi:uncharacterized protein LOC118113400 isoform X1 [Hippoglossus stenolepis]|uniref:uncharacterized protein LOC118113400 isoform X1 n=1 Tax=Hippoglossus stenolepis TaxID=195615 RepID=UPI00159C03C1|nr:uncharacterized protein LOC118113400 isoform X1 [Hippoglossus stenolepis]
MFLHTISTNRGRAHSSQTWGPVRFTCSLHALCAAGLWVPHPPLHIEHVPASYKDFTSWQDPRTAESHRPPPPRPNWCQPPLPVQLQVLSHSRSSLTPTPHRIRRNDHQTGPADTWILPPPPEASCRRGADAATGPCREPDRHDAGHHGPESVLLQCQTDDGEGPACTLNRLDSLIVEMDEPMRREGDGGRRREGSAVSFRTALFSPHCHSHTRTLNFWYPSLTIRRDVRAAF